MPANLPRKLGTIRNKKEADVEVFEDDELRVYFSADADIDTDGANGRSGAPAAMWPFLIYHSVGLNSTLSDHVFLRFRCCRLPRKNAAYPYR